MAASSVPRALERVISLVPRSQPMRTTSSGAARHGAAQEQRRGQQGGTQAHQVRPSPGRRLRASPAPTHCTGSGSAAGSSGSAGRRLGAPSAPRCRTALGQVQLRALFGQPAPRTCGPGPSAPRHGRSPHGRSWSANAWMVAFACLAGSLRQVPGGPLGGQRLLQTDGRGLRRVLAPGEADDGHVAILGKLPGGPWAVAVVLAGHGRHRGSRRRGRAACAPRPHRRAGSGAMWSSVSVSKR